MRSFRPSAPPFAREVVTGAGRRSAGSLFERLLLDEEELVPFQHGGIDAVLASIKKNLDRALNVHAGGAAANPLLGMVNFSDGMLTCSDIANDGIAAIELCILNAEPRISSVEVRHIPDADLPLSLKFSAVCSVRVLDYSEMLVVDLIMRDGKFHQNV